MTTTDLAVATPSTFDMIGQAADLATRISRTEFVPAALRNKPEAVMAAMLTGHEIGVGPMASLAKIHVIDGRPALAAELMRAIVLRAGHEIWTEESSTTKVTLCGQRAGSEHVTRVTWTMDDAKRAKLDGKNNWRAYPRAMLMARATGELCRTVFADVLGGISYTEEEVRDGFDDDPWNAPVDDDGPPPPATTTRKAAAPRKKAAAKKSAAPRKAAAPASGPPPAPPLPGEEEGERDDNDTKRAQRIAMRANDVGVDHHHVVAVVTNGEKTSAKGLTDMEADAVFEALRQIKVGEVELREGDDGCWALVDPAEPVDAEVVDEDESEPVDDTEGDGDEVTWDAEAWVAYLREQGVTQAAGLKTARSIAQANGEELPSSLDDLQSRPQLAAALRAAIEGEEPF